MITSNKSHRNANMMWVVFYVIWQANNDNTKNNTKLSKYHHNFVAIILLLPKFRWEIEEVGSNEPKKKWINFGLLTDWNMN